MQSLPTLSVLMTAYNRERFIGEAIESVLASTYENFELIIVDDNSLDNTWNIVRDYAMKDDRIRLYRNEKNLGDYPNRNQAASYATGEFIMYVDSDDKILKEGFERCIRVMQRFPEGSIGMMSHSQEVEPFYQLPAQVLKRHFFERPCLMIGPGGTIMRRDFFEKIGGYPVKYGPANDMYFNLKAAASSGIVFLPFAFNFYRTHEGQEINNKYSYLYNNYRYLKDALSELSLHLNKREMEWINNKNKRRFLVNLIHYLFQSKNLPKVAEVRRMAGFGWKDFWKALVHPNL